MKKNFALILILYCLFSYSQHDFGIVTYSIQPINFELKNPNSPNTNLNKELKATAEKQKYSLEFNKSYSKFHKIDILNEIPSDENTKDAILLKIAILRFLIDYDFYLNTKDSLCFYKKYDNSIIKKSMQTNHWEITSETKKIGEYNCFKAIYIKTYINRKGKSVSRPITAWFAPSLPYSYGPVEYYGLPGLILELQDKETVYIATSINLKIDTLKIDMPKGKTISMEEYEQKVISKK